MKTAHRCILCALGLALLGATGAGAVSPEALSAQLGRGDPVTVIDIRPNAVYRQGHIPGAINVPAAVLAAKRLPRLGAVVAYGGGLGAEDVAAAVEQLNAKPGIAAVALAGGYAAWEAEVGTTTRPPGLGPERLHQITYQQLLRSKESMVLVDLRGRRSLPGSGTSDPLAELASELGGLPVTREPFAYAHTGEPGTRPPGPKVGEKPPRPAPAAGGSSSQPATSPTDPPGSPDPLLVLVDDDHRTAGEVARCLYSAGYYRAVVLIGGEEMIVHRGRSGLSRRGGTLGTAPGAPAGDPGSGKEIQP